MSNVYIEQGQCVLPSHLFWRQLGLNGKILQGHIVGPQHHIFGTYVMALSLETMYDCPHFLFMCWPTFVSFRSTFCFQMPPVFLLALGFLQLQSWRHRSGSQNPCWRQVTSTLTLSPKCLSRSKRPYHMLHPIRKFWRTFSRGLSRVWPSLQNSWWTCDNRRPYLRRISRPELT